MSRPPLEFRYLSETDMVAAGVTDMAACVDTMAEVLALFARGDYRMAGPDHLSHGSQISFPAEETFPGMPVDGPDRRFMAMPAYLGGEYQVAGCKWYGSNTANRSSGLPRSILMLTLNDKDTGAPLAYMSANLLSAYRTGAVPGVGARLLARMDARVVGLVGPGPINRAAFEAYMAVRPGIDTLKIAGLLQSDIDEFLHWAAERYPQLTTAAQVDGIEAAVRGSDIVSIAVPTPSGSEHYPHVENEWVQPGAFICSPSHLSLAEDLVNRARHVVDARAIYESWAAELRRPAHEEVGLWGFALSDRVGSGRLSPGKFEDIGEILEGMTTGRTHEDEVFVYGTGGMPIEDVAWGTKIYQNAVAQGIGTLLPVWGDEP